MSVKNHRASLRERFRLMCHHYGLLPTLALHAWFVLRAIVKKLLAPPRREEALQSHQDGRASSRLA